MKNFNIKNKDNKFSKGMILHILCILITQEMSKWREIYKKNQCMQSSFFFTPHTVVLSCLNAAVLNLVFVNEFKYYI